MVKSTIASTMALAAVFLTPPSDAQSVRAFDPARTTVLSIHREGRGEKPTDDQARGFWVQAGMALGPDIAQLTFLAFRSPNGADLWACGLAVPRAPSQAMTFTRFVAIRSIPGQVFTEGHPYFATIAAECWHPPTPPIRVPSEPVQTPLQPIGSP
jgi:hypothetical protein